MLLLGSRLIGTSIISLQTGMPLAIAKAPVIDPANLKILAYEVEGPMLVERPSYIRIADVRELSNIGMIIDSSDEFIGKDDVIAIKKLLDLNFTIIGMPVIDDTRRKLGKVIGYTIDTDGFTVQTLSVKANALKRFTETELIIHRNQIIEINDYAIIVKSAAKKLQPIEKPTQRLTYLNPFRSTSPQPESSDL